MIDQKLIFIGRTGVGKSSLINYFSGTSKCETDKYRPCTKESKVVTTQINGVNYELIDTPGLGEAGTELDHLYLQFIDQYLVQEEVSPVLVFKSDDSRLRSEDYSLLQTLCIRFGNRIFNNCSLFLTFGGNLDDNYYPKVCRRVHLITTEIYKTQRARGHKLFPGFKRIELIDSNIGKVYELDPWLFEKTFPISPEVMIASSIQKNDFKDLGKVLAVDEVLCQGILQTLIESRTEHRNGNAESLNFDEWSAISECLCVFPFHNTIETKACPLDMNYEDAPLKKLEPNSVYEVAEILVKNDIEESIFSIKNGLLSVQRTTCHRKLANSEQYDSCLRLDAQCFKGDSGQFKFFASFKLTNHSYTDEGEPDEDKIIDEANNAPQLCFVELDGIVDFIKIILFPSYVLWAGEDAMKKGMIDALRNDKELEKISINF